MVDNGKYYLDDKYKEDVASYLKNLDSKVHYKLYMLYTGEGSEHRRQEDIAGAMGVERQQFAKYIRVPLPGHGKLPPQQPSMLSLFRLGQALNIPLYYFTHDDIDYMADPTKCKLSENDEPDGVVVNKELIPFLLNDKKHGYLRKQFLEGKHKLDTLIEETGLTPGILEILTPAALEKLTQAIKGEVVKTLSDHSNINEPQNPLDYYEE